MVVSKIRLPQNYEQENIFLRIFFLSVNQWTDGILAAFLVKLLLSSHFKRQKRTIQTVSHHLGLHSALRMWLWQCVCVCVCFLAAPFLEANLKPSKKSHRKWKEIISLYLLLFSSCSHFSHTSLSLCFYREKETDGAKKRKKEKKWKC